MSLEAMLAAMNDVMFVSRRQTSLIPVCCLCGLIRDVSSSSLHCEHWVTRRTYRKTYGVNPADCVLTHTYCPDCFTQVIAQVREDNEATRTEIPVVA
jgi:hypothetical protein